MEAARKEGRIDLVYSTVVAGAGAGAGKVQCCQGVREMNGKRGREGSLFSLSPHCPFHTLF